MSTIFKWGLYKFHHYDRVKKYKLIINSKQETSCIIFTHLSPNPSVSQNIAWQYNVTNLT